MGKVGTQEREQGMEEATAVTVQGPGWGRTGAVTIPPVQTVGYKGTSRGIFCAKKSRKDGRPRKNEQTK